MTLSETGAALAPKLSQLFLEMEQLLNANIGPESSLLRISAVPSFANQWLAPRLGRFLARFPQYQVRIAGEDRLESFDRDDVDIGLRYGSGDYPELHKELIATAEAFPVCSPAFAEEHARELVSPEGLLGLPLLEDELGSAAPGLPSWRAWFAAAGIDAPAPMSASRFASLHMALMAAVSGQGVALAVTPLADSELSSGRLVRLFDTSDPERLLVLAGVQARSGERAEDRGVPGLDRRGNAVGSSGVAVLNPDDPDASGKRSSLQPVDFEPHRKELGEQLGSGMKLKIGAMRRTAVAAKFASLSVVERERHAEHRADASRPQLLQVLRVGSAHQCRTDRRIFRPSGKHRDRSLGTIGYDGRQPVREGGFTGGEAAAAGGLAIADRQAHAVVAGERTHSAGAAIEKRLAATVGKPRDQSTDGSKGVAEAFGCAGNGFEEYSAVAELKGDVEQVVIVGQADAVSVGDSGCSAQP